MCREQIIIDRVERAFGIKNNESWWKGLTKRQKNDIRMLAETESTDDFTDSIVLFAKDIIKQYDEV